MAAPIDTPHSLGSLANNDLGCVKYGIYTAEGINKLCEGLKGSSVTSLKCAAAHRVFAFVSAPADKKANTLKQPSSLKSHAHALSVPLIALLCAP